MEVVPKLPCQVNPQLWDLPFVRSDVSAVYVRALAAVALEHCASCPALRPCLADARRHPPQHYCVQGGLIWRGGGRAPITYAQWRPARVPFPERATIQ